MLKKLARTSYRRRWPVVIIWVILLAGLLAIGAGAGGSFKTEFGSLPGTESQAALEILEERGFVERTGDQAQIVFTSEAGVQDPAVEAAMTDLFAAISAEIEQSSVVSPYEPGGERQISADGTIAYAEVNLAERSNEEYLDAGERIRELGDAVAVEGLQIEYGGNIFIDETGGGSSEFIGLIGAVIILLIAFGSVLAMGLPIGTALFGVGSGAALILLATRVMDIPDFTMPAAIMIGIGVGIDYALFIVTRFRQGLREGRAPEDAAVLAIDTAGRAVLFAGGTVVISLLGMFAMGLSMIQGLAIGASATVLMTMVASVTLLPALLGFARERIDKLGLPHRNSDDTRSGQTIWHRWSRVIQRRPLPFALAGLVFLLALTIPVFSMRLGFSDASNRPETDTTRRAYDLLSEGFGPGFNGPFLVAAEAENGQVDLATLDGLSQQLNQTEGVAYASPPFPNEAGDAAIIQVIPTTGPQDAETEDLVHRLRDGVVDEAIGESSMEVHVGGITAATVDFADFTGDRMPIFFGAVLILSFLLLMMVFRSLLVPVKAVIMNLLSIGSAFGLMIAVFQWGWLNEALGVSGTGPIEAWAPMMIFAVVFGLSMDYEVFLLSRIREEYDRTGDNASAVADGLANTARVITAAAAIMIVVFSSFVLGEDRDLQMLGFGLAVAVLIDATLVRLVLVPATMELLGKANWWLPGWLNRILPAVHFEGEPESPPATPAAAPRTVAQVSGE
ncbi:MAG TPA: MMPL family transporter [Thermomicrobiales bacterium]|nr:MMPL family transporter [Thermomicrobiales bacterium]